MVIAIIIISAPFYYVLDNFDITLNEKIIFSITLGLTLFPSFAFLIGFLVPFKVSIIITFIILTVISFIIKKLKK